MIIIISIIIIPGQQDGPEEEECHHAHSEVEVEHGTGLRHPLHLPTEAEAPPGGVLVLGEGVGEVDGGQGEGQAPANQQILSSKLLKPPPLIIKI